MTTAVLGRDLPAAPVAGRGDRFYLRMAVAFAAIAVIGFTPTYWLPLSRRGLDVHPLAHVHALVFYGWIALVVWQTSLAANGRLVRHREVGLLGVALATAMCFVGVGMAADSIKRSEAAGFGEAGRAFSIVSLSAIALFAALFALAIRAVKRPEVHKRLMLVATASLLQAAVGRWFLLFLAPQVPAGVVPSPPPVVVTIMPGSVVDLLIVIAMVHDRRTTGSVHSTYWYAGAAVLAVQLLRVPMSTTAAWHWITGGVLAFFP
ncbi:MAG: hypothetical protein ABIS06_09545 [Vicinamibacterales bacterium]